MVKKLILIGVVFNICLTVWSQASLHIISEPDVVVYLNGKIQGVTTLKAGGLHLNNIADGNQVICLYKLRHIIQEDSITINKNEGMRYYASPFVINENEIATNFLVSKQKPKGNLKIQSLPVNITVDIPELGVSSQKIEDKFMVGNVSSGKYLIKYIWNEKTLTDSVEIKQNEETHIFVNMFKTQLTNKSTWAKQDEALANETNNRASSNKDQVITSTQVQSKGNLKIQSIPVNIQIELPQLQVTTQKTEDKFLVNNLASGKYVANFTWNLKTVSDTIEIKQDVETHIFVNMLKLEVTNKSLWANQNLKSTSNAMASLTINK